MDTTPIGDSRLNLYLRRRHTATMLDRQAARIETTMTAAPLTIHGTAGGDARRLRGIPAIGRNVQGAIPGTSPHLHLRD